MIVQDALPTKYTIRVPWQVLMGVGRRTRNYEHESIDVHVYVSRCRSIAHREFGRGRCIPYHQYRNTLPSIPFPKPLSYDHASLKVVTDYMSSFYIPVRIEDQATNVNWSNDLTALFLQYNVKIQQLSMPNVGDSDNNTSTFHVIVTDTYPLSTIQKVCTETQHLFTTTNVSILHFPILPIE